MYIDGLTVLDDVLIPQEAEFILNEIDALPWRKDLSRRVQHYGYVYDYKRRSIDPDMYLGELPGWLGKIGRQLYLNGYFSAPPKQCIVNEYMPGQGITPHIDCEPCFGGVIASISLGSACLMTFTHVKTGEVEEVLLRPRSLMVMQGAARYEWQHGITARKSDVIYGVQVRRERRVSVTFRQVITAAPILMDV